MTNKFDTIFTSVRWASNDLPIPVEVNYDIVKTIRCKPEIVPYLKTAILAKSSSGGTFIAAGARYNRLYTGTESTMYGDSTYIYDSGNMGVVPDGFTNIPTDYGFIGRGSSAAFTSKIYATNVEIDGFTVMAYVDYITVVYDIIDIGGGRYNFRRFTSSAIDNMNSGTFSGTGIDTYYYWVFDGVFWRQTSTSELNVFGSHGLAGATVYAVSRVNSGYTRTETVSITTPHVYTYAFDRYFYTSQRRVPIRTGQLNLDLSKTARPWDKYFGVLPYTNIGSYLRTTRGTVPEFTDGGAYAFPVDRELWLMDYPLSDGTCNVHLIKQGSVQLLSLPTWADMNSVDSTKYTAYYEYNEDHEPTDGYYVANGVFDSASWVSRYTGTIQDISVRLIITYNPLLSKSGGYKNEQL